MRQFARQRLADYKVPRHVNFLPALLTDRGREYEFRALSNGQTLGDAQDNDFTYNLVTLQPFSPVHIAGSQPGGAGTDLTITWIRRARLNADWATGLFLAVKYTLAQTR